MHRHQGDPVPAYRLISRCLERHVLEEVGESRVDALPLKLVHRCHQLLDVLKPRIRLGCIVVLQRLAISAFG